MRRLIPPVLMLVFVSFLQNANAQKEAPLRLDIGLNAGQIQLLMLLLWLVLMHVCKYRWAIISQRF